MTVRSAAAFLAAILAVSSVAPALADLPIPSANSGTITKIEWGKQRFWIKNEHGETLRVNAGKGTHFKYNGKPAGFDRLKVGEKARVFSGAIDLNNKSLDAHDVDIWGHYPAR